MPKKTLIYSTVLALLFFVLFLPLQGAAAVRGTLERDRVPVSALIGGSSVAQPPAGPEPEQPVQPPPVDPDPPQPPSTKPDPVQPPPAEPDRKSDPDNFRYVSPPRGSRSGGVYVPVSPGSPSPSLPENNSPSPGMPADPPPVQPPSPSEPEVPAGLTAQEAEAYTLLNAFRAENNLPPLLLHPELVKVARLKAQDLAENNYFGHVSPTYGSIGQMLRAAGISYSGAAENLSKAGNISQAHLQLVYSTQGHRQIMLSPEYNKVGIGVLPLQNVPGIIMVQLFIKD